MPHHIHEVEIESTAPMPAPVRVMVPPAEEGGEPTFETVQPARQRLLHHIPAESAAEAEAKAAEHHPGAKILGSTIWRAMRPDEVEVHEQAKIGGSQ